VTEERHHAMGEHIVMEWYFDEYESQAAELVL